MVFSSKPRPSYSLVPLYYLFPLYSLIPWLLKNPPPIRHQRKSVEAAFVKINSTGFHSYRESLFTGNHADSIVFIAGEFDAVTGLFFECADGPGIDFSGGGDVCYQVFCSYDSGNHQDVVAVGIAQENRVGVEEICRTEELRQLPERHHFRLGVLIGDAGC